MPQFEPIYIVLMPPAHSCVPLKSRQNRYHKLLVGLTTNCQPREVNMLNNITGAACIEVVTNHTGFAFIYDFFSTTITIDGVKHKSSWGPHQFHVTPGTHTVSVSYPWILSRECGKATITVAVLPDQTRKIIYHTHAIRYIPGSIKVD